MKKIGLLAIILVALTSFAGAQTYTQTFSPTATQADILQFIKAKGKLILAAGQNAHYKSSGFIEGTDDNITGITITVTGVAAQSTSQTVCGPVYYGAHPSAAANAAFLSAALAIKADFLTSYSCVCAHNDNGQWIELGGWIAYQSCITVVASNDEVCPCD